MRTLLLVPFVIATLLACIKVPLLAQEKNPSGSDKPPESDTTILIPTSIKDFQMTLTFKDKELKDDKIEVPIQYSVQGKTIFVLPVWVAGNVERVIEGESVPLKPDDRLIPEGEKRPVMLRVTGRNLLESPDTEKTIVEQLRQRVIDQQGLDSSTKFKIERPNINPAGIRFTLFGAGRGDDASPAEIAIANPVARPLDGVLSFTLDPVAIRKIETDRA